MGRNWGEVTSNEFLFNRSEKEVEALGKVTLEEVKTVLEPLLKERKISVQVGWKCFHFFSPTIMVFEECLNSLVIVIKSQFLDCWLLISWFRARDWRSRFWSGRTCSQLSGAACPHPYSPTFHWEFCNQTLFGKWTENKLRLHPIDAFISLLLLFRLERSLFLSPEPGSRALRRTPCTISLSDSPKYLDIHRRHTNHMATADQISLSDSRFDILSCCATSTHALPGHNLFIV